jgi:hypothetical protein
VVIVHLRNGRLIDVSDLAPGDVVAKLRAAGVQAIDIDRTVHHVGDVLPVFLCPMCGRRSYNRNDVEQRYCGACHQFMP